MSRISDYYMQACTEEYLLENNLVEPRKAWYLAGEIREKMNEAQCNGFYLSEYEALQELLPKQILTR